MTKPTQEPSTASSQPTHQRPDAGLSARIWLGLALVMILLAAIGGWASTAKLAGAIIAPGQLVVDGNTKLVQHPTGGVIALINVVNGHRARKGDILLRLDDTQTRAGLAIIETQLLELTARSSRLRAQRDSNQSITFPDGFETSSAEARNIAKGERRLFSSERKSRDGQVSQLRERITQLHTEIKGLTAQRLAKAREYELIDDERRRYELLYEKKLTQITRVIEKKRERARIEGEHGALTARIARTQGQITEIELQIIGLEQDARTHAQQQLRDIEARISELEERRIAATDSLDKIEIRAPASGIVHDLNFHTVGGVIGAGKPILHIVPVDEDLTIEARVAPGDIDQVRLQQTAMLRFTAFNQRTTPELRGQITRVGADLTSDPRTGQSYYRVRIKADEEDLPSVSHLNLVPGMPVESFIQTGDRTTLSYLLKPLTDHFARAWLED